MAWANDLEERIAKTIGHQASVDRHFVDTNVFDSAVDRRDAARRVRALNVVATTGDKIVVSTQVLLELHANPFAA